MTPQQAQQQISDLFSKPFDRERYTAFLRNLLNKVEPRDKQYSGTYVPEAYRDHIHQYWRIGKYTDPDGEELDLLVVEVKSLAKLDRARSALREIGGECAGAVSLIEVNETRSRRNMPMSRFRKPA